MSFNLNGYNYWANSRSLSNTGVWTNDRMSDLFKSFSWIIFLVCRVLSSCQSPLTKPSSNPDVCRTRIPSTLDSVSVDNSSAAACWPLAIQLGLGEEGAIYLFLFFTNSNYTTTRFLYSSVDDDKFSLFILSYHWVAAAATAAVKKTVPEWRLCYFTLVEIIFPSPLRLPARAVWSTPTYSSPFIFHPAMDVAVRHFLTRKKTEPLLFYFFKLNNNELSNWFE